MRSISARTVTNSLKIILSDHGGGNKSVCECVVILLLSVFVSLFITVFVTVFLSVFLFSIFSILL